MYVTNKLFEESRTDVLHALMKSYPLAALVTVGGSELHVSHIPMLLNAGDGSFGTLRGHVARANPIWRQFGAQFESLAIFQGPQTYITPSWYPSKHAHGKAVPTWNYAVVHARGRARAVDDAGWLLKHLGEMTGEHESRQDLPWKLSDAPAQYIDRLLEAIVGIEIPISMLSGTWKVSQNRLLADKLGVAAGLQSRDGDESRDMAALVMQHVT